MTQILNPKHNNYDLEERTLKFSRRALEYTNTLPKTITNVEIIKQLIRAACSIGANYIEANESLSKKDFVMRIKICKKEAKETIYWLNLSEPDPKNQPDKGNLTKECTELMKIFGAILEKSK